MNPHHQLLVKREQLERELARAFSTQPWPGSLIDRLVNELSEIEREIETVGRDLAETE